MRKYAILILTGLILIVGCKKKVKHIGVEYDEETGEIYVPDATIIVNGNTYNERATMSDTGLALIITADSNYYFYSPKLGDIDSLNLLNSRKAIVKYLEGILGHAKSEERVGIEITQVNDNEYEFKNKLFRWAGIKQTSINKIVLIRPKKLFDIDLINTLTGNWSDAVIVWHSYSDTLQANSTDTFHLVGEFSMGIFGGGFIEAVLEEIQQTLYKDQLQKAYKNCKDLVVKVQTMGALNSIFVIVRAVAGALGTQQVLAPAVESGINIITSIVETGVEKAITQQNDEEMVHTLSNDVLKAVVNYLIDAVSKKEQKFVLTAVVILILKAIALALPVIEETIGSIQATFAGIYDTFNVSIALNNPPDAPVVSGPDSAQVNESVTFTASATDPDEDNVAIRFSWGDGDTSSWSSYVSSGQSISMSHTYTSTGTYYVKAQAKDINGAISDWSSTHKIVIYSGQTEQITWTKTYGGSDDDWGCSVQQTQDGGYIIAGGTWSFGAGGYDVYLIKTDANGNVEWTKTYGGSSYDCGFSVQQTKDGGFIIAGYTCSFGAGYADVYLIKTDAYGNVEWTKTYGGSDYDFGYSVQQTQDGGYIIAGKTCSFGAGGYDVYLIKTDANGNVEWTKTYGGGSDDCGFSAQQAQDGGFIIAGGTWSFGAGGYDVYLIKTDANGNVEWTKTYGGSSYDCGFSVQQTKDGGFIIAGYTCSFGAGYADVYLIKTDAYGNVEWTKTYGGSSYDYGKSVQQTQDGGFIIAGYTCSFGAGGADVYLIKTDANGNVEWTKTYGGSDEDYGFSVQQTQDDGYIIAGRTYSFGAGGEDVYLIKTDANGNVSSKISLKVGHQNGVKPIRWNHPPMKFRKLRSMH